MHGSDSTLSSVKQIGGKKNQHLPIPIFGSNFNSAKFRTDPIRPVWLEGVEKEKEKIGDIM
jgi:hypothetical protein